MRTSLLMTTCVFGLPLWLAACAPEGETLDEPRATATNPGAALRGKPGPSAPTGSIPVLNTFHPEWLQIDADEAAPPGDANLYTGADPADGTASYDLPAGGSSYIDWEDLAYEVDEHRYLDLEGAKGRDPSAFPRSDSCMGPAHVLSKMDLTYVAVVNNTDYASFAVQRSGNNGDAGYYWLITWNPPNTLSSSSCRTTEQELSFDLSGPDPDAGTEGDLMLAGHFIESDVPLFSIYRAVGDTTGTLAVDALDFEDTSLWTSVTNHSVVAVNETTTRAGSFGAAGVDASDGVDLEADVFAEAAVDVALLQGEDVCGGTFYATVITRSSGAGGTSPDLKDVAGPFALNFTAVEATASLQPLCDGMVAYEAVNTEDNEVTCDWVFDDGTTVTDSCSGTVAVTPGTRYATMTMTALDTPCDDEVVTEPVVVGGTLAASAWMEGSCDESFAYGSDVTNGVGTITYDWSFTDASGVVIATASGADGYQATPGAGAYAASLIVTDDRGGGLVCTAEATANVDVLANLSVTPTLTGSCDETLGYEAAVTGGDGFYTYAWTFSDAYTSAAPSGVRSLGAQPRGGATYGADLTVSWMAEDGMECVGTGSASATVYSPIAVKLSPDGVGGECLESDAVTYTATITGGGPGLVLDWTLDTCDGAETCTIDPAATDPCESVDLQLAIHDPGECPDAASEHESYTKYTVVTVSDN